MQLSVKRLASVCLGSIAVAIAAGATITQTSMLAQDRTWTDPDFGVEVQENTVCSFITGDGVNIRSGPGTQHDVVTQLNRGDGVRALFREGDWVLLAARTYGFAPDARFEPLAGWVYNQFINGCSEDQFDRWRG